MIDPEVLHRFKGDSGVDIGSQEIEARFPDGQKLTVVLRLGAPFSRDDQWWIRTELENLDRTSGPIVGADSLHAVLLGIQWMILRLQSYEQKLSCRYFWPGTETVFEYRSYLSTGRF